MVWALSDQYLLMNMSSTCVNKKWKNYSSGEIDKYITNIQTWYISQAKEVHKYGIPRLMLVNKYKKKIENVSEKSPRPMNFIGEAPEKDLVKWDLAMQKQGLPVGQETIIQKAYETHQYKFGSMRSIGLVG